MFSECSPGSLVEMTILGFYPNTHQIKVQVLGFTEAYATSTGDSDGFRCSLSICILARKSRKEGLQQPSWH